MKIALFEDILERHVRRSLSRALTARGHEVIECVPCFSGHHFPTEQSDIERITTTLESIVEQRPDALLNFRASTLTPSMIEYVKGKGVQTLVWLPDDPVLYGVCYSNIVEHYDFVLNCGGLTILEWYERQHDVRGINFPFWTDRSEFPLTHDPRSNSEFDIAFLGQIKGPIRRQRYDLLASLPGEVRIYGRIESDPKKLYHGYLTSAAETASVLGRAKLAFNIPQFFEHYRGHEYDFPELSSMGHFQYPSRVIQYASVGLPILTYGPDRPPETFPEMLAAPDIATCISIARELLPDTERLSSIAERTSARFLSSFDASARAEFLEEIVAAPDRVKSASATERARMFARNGAGFQ
jgi:hypothetical protein